MVAEGLGVPKAEVGSSRDRLMASQAMVRASGPSLAAAVASTHMVVGLEGNLRAAAAGLVDLQAVVKAVAKEVVKALVNKAAKAEVNKVEAKAVAGLADLQAAHRNKVAAKAVAKV